MVSLCEAKSEETNLSPYKAKKKVSLPELQITRESHTCGQGKQKHEYRTPSLLIG